MVMTRSMYARYLDEVPDLSSLIPTSWSTQHSSQESQAQPTIHQAYRDSDTAHRHRLRDNEPYDQQVVAYTRRKRLA